MVARRSPAAAGGSRAPTHTLVHPHPHPHTHIHTLTNTNTHSQQHPQPLHPLHHLHQPLPHLLVNNPLHQQHLLHHQLPPAPATSSTAHIHVHVHNPNLHSHPQSHPHPHINITNPNFNLNLNPNLNPNLNLNLNLNPHSIPNPNPNPNPAISAHPPAPSSEDDSTGSWPIPPPAHHNRHAINRQLALNTLAAMHRRFSLPSIISTNGRPLAEFRASANKSLDILRQNIQAAVTKEIDQVIKKYLEKFFVPAVTNIRTNLGEESVSEEQLRAVCRAMLDGARNLYAAPPRPVQARPTASPSELSDSESSNGADSRFGRPGSSPYYGKRKESDTDSDVGVGARRKRRIEKTAAYAHKWDPARLTHDTLFIMGSIANKVLGLGQSRGRLYSKHAGLLRYPADSADKEWIATQNLKTTAGGRTYIMVLEDIEELIVSDDYRHSSTLRLSELSCFRAPPFMLRKIQTYLNRRGEISEDYASSTPTPTPPPVDTPLTSCSDPTVTEEHVGGQCVFNIASQVNVENAEVQLLSEIHKPKTDIVCDDLRIHYNPNHCNQNTILESVNNNSSSVGGNFTTVVSSGISSLDNSYWKSTDVSKDSYDSSIKVELNSAAELMDADIEFLSSDFCSYADSEADVKKSFDKLSDGGDMFLTTGNTTLLPERVDTSDAHSVTMNQQLTENSIQKSPVVTSIVGNIAVGSLPSDVVHTYMATTSNPSLITFTGNTTLHTASGCTFSTPQLPTSFSQTLPSFSQISAPLQAQIITQTTPTTVTWQANVGQPTTRTVYSLTTNSSKSNTTIPPGTAIVGLANRATITGNILTNAGGFINLTPKSFSSGNILHNAIVSRNMVNRGLTNRIDLTKSVQNSMNPISSKPSIILPGVSTFARSVSVSLPTSKIDLTDDASITTTKAMIDNTCNSSAMLKQVLTLGSAGVNKTFLTPPTQKNTSVKPPTSSASALSASHATLTALLSGVDPSHSDKKNTFVISKGDK